MTIFYRSNELVIDNEAMVELLSAQRFALRDLSRVSITRRDDDQSRRLATPALVGALVVAATGTYVGSPAGWLATAMAVVMLVGVGGVARLLRRPRWQLLAVYRGTDVCLLSTTDARTFGQVRRGLLRALEAQRRR
jgi:hypothetical protein